MAEIHTITSPAVHSNDLDFSGTKNEGIAPETFASSAPNSSNLMIDLDNTFHAPYTQDYARFGGKTGTVEVSFTSDQPQSLPQRDDNRITPQTNRKVTSPKRSNHTKLFGVLSLILQAFNTHLTAESEELCTSVLQGPCRNLCFPIWLQILNGNQICENIPCEKRFQICDKKGIVVIL